MKHKPEPMTEKLLALLETSKNKRVIVLGTTCVGKSTLLAQLSLGEDMDRLLFPQLSPEEYAYVCQVPWTEEIGQEMNRLVKDRVKVTSGKPLFGTVIIDCDLIIYLQISEQLLRQRCSLRNVNFEDAWHMQEQIQKDVDSSGIPKIDFFIG